MAQAKTAEKGAPAKQAACLECRRGKIKCSREPDSQTCRRCVSNGLDCVVPEYHVGRYKGVKNKRSGLEKAIHQVEQALKRSKHDGVAIDGDDIINLRQLIEKKGETPEHEKPLNATASTRSGSYVSPEQVGEPDEMTLDNADNPLQLLAMASSMPHQSPSTISTPTNSGLPNSFKSKVDDVVVQLFFSGLTSVLDDALEEDPVELGLLTAQEAETLFAFFYENLSHTRWGLDPILHTASFVRKRSKFLYTSICTAAALFLPDTASLAKRLASHRDHLVQGVVSKRYRSLEIVLAFMINIPWMAPAKHWADDDTCHYLVLALKMALDLHLNKIVVPSAAVRPDDVFDRLTKCECIDVTKALALDGFPQVDPESPWGKRLIRTRERVWIALFVLDRGICLARGRPYAVPTGPLVETCEAWHVSDIADKWDASLVSTTVLRRDLVQLIWSVRKTCDDSRLNIVTGTAAVKLLKQQIDQYFDRWHVVWSHQISLEDGSIPPYVKILVSHTKLSTYCSVINHKTSSSDVKQFFRAAGLSSALSLLRTAVEGESRLKSMPNNTVIMVSFAACFALGLSITKQGNQVAVTPNAQKLIDQAAQVLERIGTVPKHRNGTSALFGAHIRRILRTTCSSTESDYDGHQKNTRPSVAAPPSPIAPGQPSKEFDPFDFNMSDDQIIEAINNSYQDQELFQLDENMFLDWLEWPSTM